MKPNQNLKQNAMLRLEKRTINKLNQNDMRKYYGGLVEEEDGTSGWRICTTIGVAVSLAKSCYLFCK